MVGRSRSPSSPAEVVEEVDGAAEEGVEEDVVVVGTKDASQTT